MKLYCSLRGDLSGRDAVYSLLQTAFSLQHKGKMPEIKKTPNGKPYFLDRPDIHFSLSHERTHVMCGLSDEPIGVDIESPRIVSEHAMKYFCSSEELQQFEPLDLWVLKESYVKLLGARLPLVKEIRFSRDGGRIIAPSADVTSRLYRIDGCTAAVSTYGKITPDSVEFIQIGQNAAYQMCSAEC